MALDHLLHGDGASHAGGHGSKRDHEPVASGLHFAAAGPLDRFPQQSEVLSPKPSARLGPTAISRCVEPTRSVSMIVANSTDAGTVTPGAKP